MTEKQRQPDYRMFGDIDMPGTWAACARSLSAVEPTARHLTRAQFELSSLVGERARAYMTLPQTIMQCRNPTDLMHAQMSFWQEAGRHYAESAGRLMHAWQAALASPLDGLSQPGDRAERSEITFPEPGGDKATAAERRPGNGRRAA